MTNPFLTLLPDTAPRGTWLMASAPTTAEALSWLDFEFLVVDMEHVPMTIPDLVQMLRAIGERSQAIVRLADNDPVIIKQVLDAGAETLMVPFVQTPEEAARAVAASRYPPDGFRGVAAVQRGSRYGSDTGYFGEANQRIAVIPQLETAEALSRLEEIASVDGIDALFIGPGDLAASMGVIGQPGDPRVLAAMADAAARARALGIPIGTVGPDPARVQDYARMGYDYIAIASDLGMLLGRAREWRAAI